VRETLACLRVFHRTDVSSRAAVEEGADLIHHLIHHLIHLRRDG